MIQPPVELVERFVELRTKNRAFKPDVNPFAESFAKVQAELLAFYEKQDPEQSFIAQGIDHEVPVSARQNKRTIKSLGKVFRAVGQRKFIDACNFTLSALEKLIDRERLHEFITEERTGPRTLGEPSVCREKAA
jgi:hypothetical protein